MLGVQDLDPQDPWAHYITNALKAKELFVKDVSYIVRDGEAVIVDEFTDRVMLVAAGVMASIRRLRQRVFADTDRNPGWPRSLSELLLALPALGQLQRTQELKWV